MSRVPAIRFQGFTDPWEQRKLGELGTTYGGLTGKSKEDFGHGDARFVPYTNVFDNPIADPSRLGEVEIDSSQNRVLCGDALFTVSSETPEEVGMSSVWLSDHDNLYLNSFCFGYRQDGSFDPYYLAYMLRSKSVREDIELLAQGISRFNISKGKVMEVEVPAPEMAEQRQVGALFYQLDSLITLHQRKYDKLTILKKALLDKMFPRDGEAVPKIRFAGFTDPWEQRKLDELATFGGGHTPSMTDDSNYADGEILWVTSQDVKVDYLEDTTTKLSVKGASELKLYPVGTLLMVTRSGILRHTLPVSMLRKPSTVNQDIRTICTSDECSSLWLMQYIKARSKSLLLEYGKTGTTVESIDFAKMKTMSLMLPEPSEQEVMGRFFYQLDNLITLHQRKLELLKNLKAACLDKMFV